jgi:predicted nucleic acid-binding protein
MRILLDTNIIIHRETSKIYNQDIGKLFQWFDKTHVTKIIHPLSIKEISSHQDPEVVNTMKVKIENYIPLKTESEEVEAIVALRESDKTNNDAIDTSLLKELYNNRVDFLVTEDRGIHRKAERLGIAERVFTIESYIEKATSENPDLKDYKVLAVKKEYFGNVDLSSDFFNSFKADYGEFADWFNKKADNICYICYADGEIGAFLYLKVEEKDEPYYNIQPNFPPKKRLKIGTFKVTSNGYKLGERFLKVIFDNALQFVVEEIYVTIFDKRDEQIRLIKLLEDWGFVYWGEKNTDNGIEKVYVRSLTPELNLLNPKVTYPFVSRNRNNFIVPIYPAYHTDLLPDSVLNNETSTDYEENEPYRNAIQKVYISRSWNRALAKGDLILFYRTGGFHQSVITTIGLVESVHDNIQSEQEFIQLCRKRSVFDDNELKKHWNYTYPGGKWISPFVVNFHYIYTFPKRLNMAKLIQLGIIKDVNSAPRGFEGISTAQLNIILKESEADESYLID